MKRYLQPHTNPLNDADRLAVGLSIGTGQIEGACRNLIGRRLKQTEAKWRVRLVSRMAGLCTLCNNMYSNQWNRYRDSLAT